MSTLGWEFLEPFDYILGKDDFLRIMWTKEGKGFICVRNLTGKRVLFDLYLLQSYEAELRGNSGKSPQNSIKAQKRSPVKHKTDF